MRPKCHHDEASPHDALTATSAAISRTIRNIEGHLACCGTCQQFLSILMKTYSEPRLRDDEEEGERSRRTEQIIYEQTPKSRLARLVHRAPGIGGPFLKDCGWCRHLLRCSHHSALILIAEYTTYHNLVAISSRSPSHEPFTSGGSVAAADQPILSPQLSNHLRFKHCHNGGEGVTLHDCPVKPR
jgi:hypothetical protein